MVYTKYETALEWENQEWVSGADMRKFLATADGTKVALEAARQALLEYWANMTKEPPFSHVDRFPPFVAYIAINQGDWPNKIEQMMSALNFKDQAQARDGKDRRGQEAKPAASKQQEGANDIVDDPRSQIPNDVLKAFTSSVRRMRDQIGRADKMYTQRTFEAATHVKWTGDDS